MFRRFGFASQKPSDYAETEPHIDIRQHLNGVMKSEGIIYGPTGRVVSRFVADMEGVWNGNSGQLRESYRFAEGKTDTRAWSIEMSDDGSYKALAEDLIGEARGQLSGMAAQSRYNIRLGPKGGNQVVSVNDWMYLSENGAILNRSQFRKFGIKVGELIATIRPV